MSGMIAWTDVETTGVDTREGHKLLQIAVIITDENFQELATLEQKFYYSAEAVEKLKELAGDYVTNMHAATGLWDQLPEAAETPETFDLKLLRWLQSNQPLAKTLLFGGNSITLDREFMREFLPKSYEHFSHRSLDMTSVENYFAFTQGRERFEKKTTHNALDDIRESLDSLLYHRKLDQEQATPF